MRRERSLPTRESFPLWLRRACAALYCVVVGNLVLVALLLTDPALSSIGVPENSPLRLLELALFGGLGVAIGMRHERLLDWLGL